MLLSINRWDEFQHYEHRRPPWVKLHRQLLENRHWFALSGDASKLLAECWLIASGTIEGTITDDPEDLAFRLHRDVALISSCLQELERHHFIDMDDEYASTLLAGAVPEKRRVEKSTEKRRERAPAKRKRALPEDWTPNEKHQQIAIKEGLDVDEMVAAFRDNAAGNGRVQLDWDAAFRTWLRNEKKIFKGQARRGKDKTTAQLSAEMDAAHERMRR